MYTVNLEMFFLWSFIINYSILMIWFLVFVYAKESIYNLHTRWFDISKEKFNMINYMWIGFYKLTIFVFTLVPYIAIQILD